MNQVICPHCGKEVELTQALRHEIEQAVTADLKATQQKEIEKIRTEALAAAEKKLSEEASLKEKNYLNEINELKQNKADMEQKELDLLRTKRELEEKTKSVELELQRKLGEEVAKIRETEAQKSKLEKLELEKKLTDTQKALEEAQRKSKQGSQQLQGEVLELDLESQLKAAFPEDEILPVPKGITGADIIQKVRNRAGKEAGSLIIETKRAKWSAGWIVKLKEDMRVANASEAVLIVEDLPEKLPGSGLVNGVWVTSYQNTLTVITTLRMLLMKVAQARSAAENKDEKLEDLYQYITSDNFRHKIESQLESFIQLKGDLDAEKRAMERIWSKREVQLARLERNTTGIFGELEAITDNALPPIKTLQLPDETSASDSPEELKLLD